MTSLVIMWNCTMCRLLQWAKHNLSWITCIHSTCRFWSQPRRRSQMAAVQSHPHGTWSPSKARNKVAWVDLCSALCSAFVFRVWRVGCPLCCQYWKDIHSNLMKAECFVVLSTRVNGYVTMKTSGVLHSIATSLCHMTVQSGTM